MIFIESTNNKMLYHKLVSISVCVIQKLEKVWKLGKIPIVKPWSALTDVPAVLCGNFIGHMGQLENAIGVNLFIVSVKI